MTLEKGYERLGTMPEIMEASLSRHPPQTNYGLTPEDDASARKETWLTDWVAATAILIAVCLGIAAIPLGAHSAFVLKSRSLNVFDYAALSCGATSIGLRAGACHALVKQREEKPNRAAHAANRNETNESIDSDAPKTPSHNACFVCLLLIVFIVSLITAIGLAIFILTDA